MPGLYDRVQRSPRQKTFPWWAVILAIALVVLTCIGLLIIRPLCIKNRYEACMDAVAASTIYAKPPGRPGAGGRTGAAPAGE